MVFSSEFLPPDVLDPEEEPDPEEPDPEEPDPEEPNPEEPDPEEGLDPNFVLDWLPLQLNLQPRHLCLNC